MTATTFDVHAYTHRSSDVATALLTAIDARDLEAREAALVEREEDVVRREKAIDRLERIHELKGFGTAPVAVAVAASAGPREVEDSEARAERRRFQQAFRLRERNWWAKVLGAPAQ